MRAGSIITAVNGLVKLTGTNNSTGTGVNNLGIYITGAGSAVSSTGSGGVTLIGTGGGTGASASDYGVEWDVANAVQASGTGAISITGTGGDASGSGGSNYGVAVIGALTGSTGALSITGTGGGAAGSGGSNTGVFLAAGLSDSAGVVVTGTGGDAGGTGTNNYGVNVASAAGGGGSAVSITGTGGASSGAGDDGIYVGAALSNTGSGTLTLLGTGVGTAGVAYGVYVNSVSISAVNGLVSVTGNNTSTSTAAGNDGVSIAGSGGAISSSGSGGVTLIGTGGGTGAGGSNYGIVWTVANAIQSTGSGPISITGTGGGGASDTGGSNYGVDVGAALAVSGTGPVSISGTGGGLSGATGTSNYGVYVGAALSAGGGALSVTGTGGVSSGTNNYGIDQVAAISNSGTGAITLMGTGGGTGTGEIGFYTSANITAATGNLSITGIASSTATGSGNHGVYFAGGTTSTGGTGTITIAGTATGSGAGGGAYGIYVSAGSIITAVDGLVKLTGTHNSTGTGTGNDGIYITGAGSAVSSSGAGGLTLIGTGGGTGASASDYGVVWDVANALQSSGTGAISITGTGGDASGSGGSNYGVYVNAALTGLTAALSITGTGGGAAGSGTNNVGVYTNASLVDSAGVTVMGTGGTGGGTGGFNYGVQIGAAFASAGGAASITGIGGNSSGASNYGINIGATLSNTGVGAITLMGTGGGTGLSEHGIYSTGSTSGGGGNISVTGLASATGTGSGVVLNAAGASISTTGSGTVTVAGTAKGSGAQAENGVLLNNATAVISTVNGLVSVTGTNNTTSATTGQYGVNIISGATIKSTGTGGVTVIGSGGGTDTTGSDYGVYVAGANGIAATLAAGNSPITITGTGGDSGGTGSNNSGIYFNGALTGNGGTVLVTGTGGNSSGSGNYGIAQFAAITNTGTGSITLMGTGGGTGTLEIGYEEASANTTAATGNLSITGIASSTATGSGNHGAYFGAGTTSTGGTGTITIAGTATGNGAGGSAYGVYVRAGSIITAVNGLVKLTGTNNSTGTGVNNLGIYITGAGSAVSSTGSGGVTLIGTGGGTGASASDYGVEWDVANAVQASGTGAISITGTGGDASGSGGSNYGVAVIGALTGSTGALSITGTGGGAAGSGGSNTGVFLAAGLSDSAGVVVTGTGGDAGGTGTNNYGVNVASAAGGGGSAVSITGTGGASSGAGDDGIYVGAALSNTGSGTLTLLGTGVGTAGVAYGVYVNSVSISAVNGLVSVTGNNTSTSTAAGNDGVSIAGSGGAISSSGSGGVTLIGTGGGTGAGRSNYGIVWTVANAIQSTGSGPISITGTGGGGASDTGGSNYGVDVGAALAVSGTGPVSISGTGGGLSGATGTSNYGVYVGAALSAGGGALSVTGTGGVSSGTNNYGIDQVAAISNSGTGAVTLMGTGAGNGANAFGYYSSANITAGSGNISITGASSPTASGSSLYGVALSGGTTSTSGAGTITISGTATGSGASATDVGTQLYNGAIVTAVNGLVSVTGINNSTGTGVNHGGVYITGTGSTVSSTGTGGVTVLGSAGGSGASNNDYGVNLGVANAVQSSGGGAISITGTGGDAGGTGGANFGIYMQSALTGSGAPISLTGTGSNSSGNGNYGVSQVAALSNTGTGSITLLGTGGGTGTSEIGYDMGASTTAATGNISITGIASSTATGSGNHGVYFATGTTSTGGSGTITIAGTATGNGAGGSAYGIYVSAGSIITALNGLVKLTGTHNSTGTGTGNDGIYITGAGSAVSSTGSGGVTLIGTGGGAGASGSSDGVFLSVANAIQSTGTGAISITGTGGDSGGTGGSNDGVYATAALSGGGGAISITGTPSNSSGGGNYGISLTSVAAGSGTLTLNSTGAVTASGALTANALNLLGAGGSYVLTSSGNLVTTLAGTTGSVSYAQTGALSLGTVGGTVGLTSSGTVLVNVTGNLTLASGAVVSAVGAGNALQLVDSGTFTNNAGAGALAISSGGGRWLVWSVSAASDTRGGLVPGFIQYNATYGTTTPADSTHNGFLYSSGGSMVVTVGLTGTVSKVYDTTTIATLVTGNYSLSGVINGDTVTINNPTAGTYNTIHVGTGKNVTVTGLAILSATNGGAPVYGYTLSSTSAAGAVGTITAATVTAGLTGTVSKVYDSTLAATLAAGNYTLSGVLGSDVVTLNNPTAGSYDTIHVGTGKTVTVTGLTISGANASDYALASTSTSGAVGTITARPITVTAANQSRGYGLANPTLTDAVTSGSLAGSDTLTGTPATTATAASNVGSYAITQGTVAASSDYTLTFVNGTLTVSPQAITISASAGQSKVYGADDAAAAKTAYTLTAGTLYNGNTLTGNQGRAVGESVGSYAFTQGSTTVSDGNGGANYTITFNGSTNPFTITAAPLSASIANQSKVYGGNDPTLAGITATLAGQINRSVVDINGNNTVINDTGQVAATLASLTRAAGESVGARAISAATFNALSGTAAGNYSAPTFTGSPTLTITAAPLTASIVNQTKVYGADDPLLSSITATLAGVINRTVVSWNGNVSVNDTGLVATTLATLTRTAGENVGSKAISAATFNALTGTSAGNYAVPTFTGSPTLTITAAPLTGTIGNQTKAYGGDDPALASITPTLTGLINRTVASWNGNVAVNDTGLVAATLASLTRAAGESVGARAISAATFNALSGTAAGNYSAPTFTGSPTLTITAAPLSASIVNQTKVYGADDPVLAGIAVTLAPVNRTVSTWNGGVAVNDTGLVSATVTALTRAVGENVGTRAITGATLSTPTGSAAGNYSSTATFTGSPTLTITAAPLTAAIVNQSKVYGADDTALASITPMLTGLINRTVASWNGNVAVNDTVLVAATLASLTRAAGESVGARAISAATFNALSGTAAGNYSAPTFTGSPTLTITAAPLTASIVNQTKVYGADDPLLSSIAATLAGVINRTVVSWNGNVSVNDTGLVATTLATLTRTAGENVGSKAISAATFNALTGTSAGNYAVPTFTGSPTLTITAAPLTGTIGNQTKAYGGDDPALASITPTLTGLINRTVASWNGNVAVNDTGLVAATLASLTRAAGESVGARAISAATFNALSGTAAGNYSAPTFTGSPTLTITAAPLSASIVNQTKVYGADDPVLAGIAVTLAPVNRTVSTWNGGVAVNDTGLVSATVTALTRAVGENVGTRAITGATLSTPTGSAAGNYSSTATFTGSPTLTITAAPLTAAIVNQSKVYGADDTALASITPMLTGLINRTVASWNGNVAVNDTVLVAATLASLTRAAGESVGARAISAATFNALSGTAAGNYSAPTFTGSPTLTITAAPLTASIVNQTKVYGADDPLLSSIAATLAGVINRTVVSWNGNVSVNDTGLVATTLATLTRTAGENVGSKAISAATFNALTGTSAGNYAVPTFTGSPTLTITAAPLTGTIGNQTKAYGGDDPALASITPTLTGLINRTVASWNGNVAVNDTGLVAATLASLTRAAGESVGARAISAATFNALSGTAAGNYSAPTFTGSPTLTITAAPLTGSIGNQTKVYGADDPALAGIAVTLTPVNRTVATWNGGVAVNDTGLVSATVTALTRAVGENVGTRAITGATLSTLSGSAAGNYSVATFAGSPVLTITVASLQAVIANQTKTYGADDPALSGILVTLLPPVNRTVATWNGNVAVDDTGQVTASVTGVLRAVGENVGVYAILAATLTAPTGPSAGNYNNVAPFTGAPTLTITAAALTATVANQSKVYGTDDPSLSAIAPLFSGLINRTVATWNGGLVVNDTGMVAARPGSLTRALGENLGSYAITAATFHALTGPSAANYSAPTFTGSPTLTITAAPLTGSISNQSKVYGANDPLPSAIAVTLSLVHRVVATWGGTVVVDDTGLVSATVTALTRAAGESVGIRAITGATFSSPAGAAAGNYASTVSFTGSPILTITPAILTAAITDQSKAYGAADPALSGIAVTVTPVNRTVSTWNGTIAVDDTGLVAATLATLIRAAGENVGSYLYTGATLSLLGAAAANYAALAGLAGPVTLTITPAVLSVSGVTADAKVYDGNVHATLSGGFLVGLQRGDTLLLLEGQGSFADQNSGTGKPVTATGFVLSGAGNGNYTLLQPTGLTANITPAPLTVRGTTVEDKVYDATVTAVLDTGASTLSGVLGGDLVTLSAAGSGAVFLDQNVGSAQPVRVLGFTIGGAGASNYTLIQPSGLTASITPATLVLSTVQARDKVYDAAVAAQISGSTLSGLLGTDVVTLGVISASFINPNVGVDKSVTLSGYTLVGAASGDYRLALPTGLTASITPAPLTVTAIGATKLYDAGVDSSAVPTVSGLKGHDSAAASETYDTPQIGTGKTLTPRVVVSDGKGGANYTITLIANHEGVIASNDGGYVPTAGRDATNGGFFAHYDSLPVADEVAILSEAPSDSGVLGQPPTAVIFNLVLRELLPVVLPAGIANPAPTSPLAAGSPRMRSLRGAAPSAPPAVKAPAEVKAPPAAKTSNSASTSHTPSPPALASPAAGNAAALFTDAPHRHQDGLPRVLAIFSILGVASVLISTNRRLRAARSVSSVSPSPGAGKP